MRARLTAEVRAFIVQALACFDTPSQVAETVNKQFGVRVTRQQCEAHDPTKVSGRGLAKKWADLFHDTRKQFQDEMADVAIANRAYRLRALNRMAEDAQESRNYAFALLILRQAAMEVGDLYTNRRVRVENSAADLAPASAAVEFTHRTT
jgi:hypothetical protein